MTRPKRRILKWTGLVGCILLIALWFVSLWSSLDAPEFGMFVFGYRLQLALGGVDYVDARVWFGFENMKVEVVDLEVRETPPIWQRIRWSPYFTSWLGFIPLWIPLAVVMVPSGYCWWLDRRRPPGHCQSCGYDLTGNTSGTCPECGTPIRGKMP